MKETVFKKKPIYCLTALLGVGLVIFAGCKKAEDEPGPVPVYYGVKMVDLPKLDTDFTNATQEVQASISLLKQFFRYAQAPQALVELDKLSQNASLNEAQKKVVNNLIEQTKQMIANSKAPGQ